MPTVKISRLRRQMWPHHKVPCHNQYMLYCNLVLGVMRLALNALAGSRLVPTMDSYMVDLIDEHTWQKCIQALSFPARSPSYFPMQSLATLKISTRMGPTSCLSSSNTKPALLARLIMLCSLTPRVTWQRITFACTFPVFVAAPSYGSISGFQH